MSWHQELRLNTESMPAYPLVMVQAEVRFTRAAINGSHGDALKLDRLSLSWTQCATNCPRLSASPSNA